MVELTVILRDNNTGEHKVIKDKWTAGSDSHNIAFYWTEGNFSCDCNRCSSFGLDCPCGESRFTAVALFRDDTREVIVANDEALV